MPNRDTAAACGIASGGTFVVDITNKSDYTFVIDGEFLLSGTWKSDRNVPIPAHSEGHKVEFTGTSPADSMSGLLWWVDDDHHDVYLSMAFSKAWIGGMCFTCQAGCPPANLKTEWHNAPKLLDSGADNPTIQKGCEWTPASDGLKLTILSDLIRYVPLTPADYTRNKNETGEGEAASPNSAASSSQALQTPRVEDELRTADFLAQTRPKDMLDGMNRGLQTVTSSIASGVGWAVAAPVLGAKQGGVVGCAKGLAIGVIGGAGVVVGGAVCGVAQLGRGIIQTPKAHRARLEEKVWDQELGEWVDSDLCALEREIEKDKEEEGEGHHQGSDGGGAQSSTAPAVADTEFYDLLKVRTNATPSEIKKAYYKEARQCHPDKNPGDAEATAKFQQLSKVYQVLSDPDLRKRYDREGKQVAEEQKQVQMDPTVFFGLLFGSERFTPWTGELNIAMQADHFVKTQEKMGEGETDSLLPDDDDSAKEMRKRQLRREVQCACHLREKLQKWVYGRDPDQFEENLRHEVKEMASAQFGPELLVALGEIYLLRAEIHLANELVGRFSMSKRVAHLKQTSMKLRHNLRFYRNAAGSLVRAKRLFVVAQKARPQEGADGEQLDVQEDVVKEVEAAVDDALPSFLQTAWSYVVKDIDSTMKTVSRRFLQDKSVPWQIRIRRAQALQKLGQIFIEEGTAADATQGQTGTSKALASGEAKGVLQEALLGSLREK